MVIIVPETSEYVHKNAGFTIECTFDGTETPENVIWTLTPDAGGDDKTLETAKDDYTLEFDQDAKTATLNKVNPATADDGTYSCKFTMSAGDTDTHPSASTVITVGRKYSNTC